MDELLMTELLAVIDRRAPESVPESILVSETHASPARVRDLLEIGEDTGVLIRTHDVRGDCWIRNN